MTFECGRELQSGLSHSSIMLFQENSRHWGEEKEDDAIWGIYLKKVRYQRPSSIVQIVQARGNHSLGDRKSPGSSNNNGVANSAEDNEEIAHLMWETVRVKVLRAGSLRKVIEAIANDDTDVQVRISDDFKTLRRNFCMILF